MIQELILELAGLNWILLTSLAILGLIYYLLNELEDESVRNNWKNHVSFLNSNLSWKNKWELDDLGNLLPFEKKWYYLGVYPKYKEKFFLSSTILSFLTDGEHIFQWGKNRAIEIGFLIISWQLALAWIIGKSLMSLTKEALIKKLQ